MKFQRPKTCERTDPRRGKGHSTIIEVEDSSDEVISVESEPRDASVESEEAKMTVRPGRRRLAAAEFDKTDPSQLYDRACEKL